LYRSFTYLKSYSLFLFQIVLNADAPANPFARPEHPKFAMNVGSRRPDLLKRRNGARGISNLILRALPENEYNAVSDYLEPTDLKWHHHLHAANETIEFGYFPDGGVISFVVPVSDGRSAEVGMVGREGFVGTPLAGGLDRSPHEALVQVATSAMKISASALCHLLPSTPQLGILLTKYALIYGMQLAQTAACNRLHNLEQRLARWLLMSQDRVNSTTLPYTQDLLAIMLGTDRPSVSVAAGALQEKSSIRQHRGQIEITDRPKLKTSACECYHVICEYNLELIADLT
jgi:CRP-like cAMP-binding protein